VHRDVGRDILGPLDREERHEVVVGVLLDLGQPVEVLPDLLPRPADAPRVERDVLRVRRRRDRVADVEGRVDAHELVVVGRRHAVLRVEERLDVVLGDDARRLDALGNALLRQELAPSRLDPLELGGPVRQEVDDEPDLEDGALGRATKGRNGPEVGEELVVLEARLDGVHVGRARVLFHERPAGHALVDVAEVARRLEARQGDGPDVRERVEPR